MDLYSGIKYGFENNDSINSSIEIISYDTRRDLYSQEINRRREFG